jgi:hypothetical protein
MAGVVIDYDIVLMPRKQFMMRGLAVHHGLAIKARKDDLIKGSQGDIQIPHHPFILGAGDGTDVADHASGHPPPQQAF